ncbi:Fis family transcriptional regulator [Kineobactrum sediminis]|uniref:Fis family transcriptional regulator n=1 Tax=Kineobactrum sediminis TaxID=1905677 RepID=A0A2N5Y5C2_9GAMM|nr:sigma 54-interacting transcriptional regulator [Kineobactrum sediminis]PLW83604.1 Fis family transcriptional regulator [Kineobactrum sediminis]
MPSTLQSLIGNLPEAIVIIDPVRDRFICANNLACELFGRTDTDLMQRPVSSNFRNSLPQLCVFTEALLHRGVGMMQEISAVRACGKELELEVNGSAFTLEGNDQLVTFCMRDKSWYRQWREHSNAQHHHRSGLLHWQRMHQVFENIERENQLILSAAGEGIYGVDADGCATFVNPAAERLLGWKAEDLIGHNIHTAIHHTHPDGSDYCVGDCPIMAAFKDGAVRQVDDEVFWRKDGKPIPVEYTSTPILDNGHLVGAVVLFRDVSERKIAEVKLRSALEEVERLKHKLELENAYLQEEISESYNFHHIIGRSHPIQQIIKQIQLVAPTVATVLITGESGTGKELIARAIHHGCDRNSRPLVRVNCAAIPRDLFESEFFGHIRGAFSGALNDRLGRFEVADGGTLFLDEVGELPLELQGKLLRVLQDGEFERVGESTTRSVDVRVIAATNKNLKQKVTDGLFREDLYFRLNVFPIHSVPLRERLDDIPLLTTHFLKKICQRFHKPELKISLAQAQRLQSHNWPGNIRELENLIERQVILSRGDKLRLEAPTATNHQPEPLAAPQEHDLVTEQDCRSLRHRAITGALRQTGGKIYGPDGAARIMGIKPTTLASRMRKLGIQRDQFTPNSSLSR